MNTIDTTAVWEVNDGDNSFHACYKCAYEHAVQTVGIHADLVLGKNFSVEESNFSISEDVFGEHADCSPICANCHRMPHEVRPPLSIEALEAKMVNH
jgi:hypothetical protein